MTSSILRQKWSSFLDIFTLPGSTQFPFAYYFIDEKGIGSGRFEVFNGVLREKSRTGKGRVLFRQ
jgi:hypothetical protein